ncbi:MAG: orotate phosphoribosyltransferase, partial [Flavobacteriaceae bacterium]|nr:orotate phosphoribosyltransferase [Flavobacteriaceae bacterium]
PKEHFIWASGWFSPIYCDNRVTLSYVHIRNYIRENLVKIIEEKHGKPDVIAGVATGAIAIGVLVAQELGIPFVYVRPEPKKHGRKNQIEGFLDKGQNVVVVEDLISTGKSSLNAVKALKDAGANIKGMVAIFDYGFKHAVKKFKKANIELTTLGDYENLIEQALETNYVSEKEIKTLIEWRVDPSKWNK